MTIRSMGRAVALGIVLASASGLAMASKIFIANEGDDTLTVIDAKTYKTLKTVPVGRTPHNVQVSPDGKRAWLTTNGEPQAGKDAHAGGHQAQGERGAIWAVDTQNYEVVAKIPVGSHPAHVVLTPDGRYAYATNGGENTVTIVDVEAGKAVATVPVGEYPHGLRISPDGREAYVANLKSGTVSVIDTASMKEVARVPVGKGPAQTGFTADGRTAFVSLSGEQKVALIDPVARKVVRKVNVGTVPIQLYSTPDARWLLVANQGSKQRPGDTVSVIDLKNGEVAKTLKTRPGAHGVVVDPDGRYAYVTNIYDDSISVIEIASMKVISTTATGKAPNGVSFMP